MVRSIRVKFNHNTLVLNSEGVVSGKSLCRNEIPVLMRSGKTERYEFSGFVDFHATTLKQKVAVLDVLAFCDADDGIFGTWYDLPYGCRVLGYVIGDRVYLATQHGRLMHWEVG